MIGPGTQLGQYQILEALGRGGMGEVWKARDTQLGREVAIKTLPEEFATDPDRLARFEREARLLASLNHANIAAVYGLEEQDATRFLVLELVEGLTLADRLRQGAMPVEESLRLALQIAVAVEAAHEKSVVHRDLKPANIKVTPDGKVKVLDFGLAKALVEEPASVDPADSPTLSMQATAAGTILGTAAYMSPEQVSGEPVDHRADVWAFGVVLFEMLTGRPVFTGRTASHVMGAVLNVEPDWDSLPANLHPRVRVILERSLERDVRDRLSGMSDARVEIQKALDGPAVAPAPAGAGASRNAVLPWAVALTGMAAVAVAVWTLKPADSPPSAPVVRFDHELPAAASFRSPFRVAVTVSPDGQQVAYNTSDGIYLLSVGDFEARLLPGTEEPVANVMFSPDGEWIGYWSERDGQLKKIAVNGGTPVILTPLPGRPNGASWSPEGVIVLALGQSIYSVSANGGSLEPMAELTTFATPVRPQLLPGGAILFHLLRGLNEVALYVPGEAEPDVLFPGSDVRYVPTGHLVYELDGSLYARTFDIDALAVRGEPVLVVEDVWRTDATQFSVSDSGTLAYIPGTIAGTAEGGGREARRTLVWVGRNGTEEPIGVDAHTYIGARISPDGRRAALDLQYEGDDILLWDFGIETLTRFTLDPGNDRYPVWTPDGTRIAYMADGDIYWKASSGAGDAELLLVNPGLGQSAVPYFFSPDGATLVFGAQRAADTGGDIGMITLADDAEPEWLLDAASSDFDAVLSPNGGWIAYVSNESGRSEVYLRPFPNVGDDRIQVSNAGGRSPLWSRDGTELFYLAPGSPLRLTVVEVDSASGGVPTGRRALLDWPYHSAFQRSYDISEDGTRFLAITPNDPSTLGDLPGRFNVVLNWFEELRERAPTP